MARGRSKLAENVVVWAAWIVAVVLAHVEFKSSASARHFQRYTDYCKGVCDEEDGVYSPKHVRADVNPVDFMGKIVTSQKYYVSTQFIMNLKAMVPFEDP